MALKMRVLCASKKAKITRMAEMVKAKYDLPPRGIIEQLHLKDVDYNAVSAYGHFGKDHLPWEQ